MQSPNAWVSTCLAAALGVALLSPQGALGWGRFPGGYHPDHGARWVHPGPVVVHRAYVDHVHDGGCVGCGVGTAAVAGILAGVAAGAVIAGSQPPPPPVVVEGPPPVVLQAGPPIGTQFATLPPGCQSMNVNGVVLYQCGPTWYQPSFGGNGVYYTVVPAP